MKTFEWLSSAAAGSDPAGLARIAKDANIDLFYRLAALTAQVFREDLKETARLYYRDKMHNPQYAQEAPLLVKSTEYADYLQQKIFPFWAHLEDEARINQNRLLSLRVPVFILQFHFKLRSPLISRDDTIVHPIDNPMRKEHIFKLPMISSTSWKGLFRNVELLSVWQKLMSSDFSKSKLPDVADDVLLLTHLTGKLREEKFKHPEGERENRWNRLVDAFEERLKLHLKFKPGEFVFYAGSLRFYPTFFSNLDLEIINPHDRERRVGTNPILIEAVPQGEIGLFQVVYVQPPFWRFDKERENELAEQSRDFAMKSLSMVARNVTALFSDLGIGAKRSSGYGMISRKLPNKDGFRGRLYVNFLETEDKFKPVLEFPELSKLAEFTRGGLQNESR